MSDLISRQAAIEALEQIRYALWEIDIPSPTVPEYIEHHRDVQNVMKRIDEIRDKMERLPSAQPEIIRCKDCIKRDYCRTTNIWAVPPDDDWYCGDAERRTDDSISD